ncbi:hypothetical protein FHR33_003547 [Nonomuraea dietziae]|uniref:Uncharacterized protein n=1 Tax=Nonomuraea dietziae TaxID=65515 RepID=A0A7W5YNP0_9ACTN|nr:hypothetical protein [Nonomuraea dietziae]MBB3727687.1 hypothetical protein [Nonomuraea dietziae]
MIATNDRQNSTWAMSAVVKPMSTPVLTNSDSSEAPMTSSGEEIAANMTRFVAPCPLNL